MAQAGKIKMTSKNEENPCGFSSFSYFYILFYFSNSYIAFAKIFALMSKLCSVINSSAPCI